MDLDRVFVCDIETTGFLEDIKDFKDFHILSFAYKEDGVWKVDSIYEFGDVQRLVGNPDNILVFHNGICYDKPVLEKMGFIVRATIIDTLGISYYLYPERRTHGLEFFGEFFGVKKPTIEDFKGIGRDKKEIIEYYESLEI